MSEPRYDLLDDALKPLRSLGPQLKNGFVNHAPMAAEALVAMGQGGHARPWVDANLGDIIPANDSALPLDAADLESAIGDPSRQDAWRSYFRHQLARGSWESVLEQWADRLAPGLFAAAAHGLIRAGHGVRALRVEDTPLRRRELAEGLALWAGSYQPLITLETEQNAKLSPKEALARVPLVPHAKRQNDGAITTALTRLEHAQGFASVISLIDVNDNPVRLANEIAAEFAQVFLYRVHTPLTAIVFTHAITAVAAILNIAPHVTEATVRKLISYGWQAAAGLHSAYSEFPAPGPGALPPETPDQIAVRAAEHGDDHVIKLSEACLAFYKVTGDERFLMVPSHARSLLPENPFAPAREA